MSSALFEGSGRPGAAVSAAADAPPRSRVWPATTLRLLGIEAAFEADVDLGRVFRHRYVLAHYVGLAAPIFASFLTIGPRTTRDSEHMPSVMVGIVVMLWAIAAYVGLLRWWQARRSGDDGTLFVPLLPGLMVGVVVLMVVSLVYGLSSDQLGGWSPGRLALLYGVILLYVGGAAFVILIKPVPRAVAELRASAARLRQVMPEPASAKAEPAATEERAGAPVDPVPAILLGVLRLEAQGNHVLVVTETGRHVLPGPFGAMLERLPPDLGRQVHRSHWVACRAVLRTRRQGRDMVIETVDGERVPVSASKLGVLRDWLARAAAHGTAAAGGARPEAEA